MLCADILIEYKFSLIYHLTKDINVISKVLLFFYIYINFINATQNFFEYTISLVIAYYYPYLSLNYLKIKLILKRKMFTHSIYINSILSYIKFISLIIVHLSYLNHLSSVLTLKSSPRVLLYATVYLLIHFKDFE